MADSQAQTENLAIRRSRHEDIPKILELFSVSFGSPESEEWFLWKYERSPWSTAGYVAFDKDMAVAFYGGLKLKFSFRGKTLWAYQFCDVMTHPAYRGKFAGKRPVIVRLGEMFYAENRMDFAFGFPSPRHARLQSLMLGGEGYRHVGLYKKENLKKSIFQWKLSVKDGQEFLKSGEMKEFLLKHDYSSLHLAKDEKYIKWRYIDNPSKKCRLLVFKRINKSKGFIIFTIDDGWFNILEIFYMELKGIEGILTSLETYLARSVKDIKGIKAWFHPKEPLKDFLESLGYRHEDGVPIAFKGVNRDSGITSDIFYNQYFYRMGDYDAA